MLQNSADDLARTFQFRRARSTDDPKRSNVHHNYRILIVRIQALKVCPSHSHAVCFTLFVWELSTLTKVNFATTTNLAVRLIEFCQCTLDESYISRGLGGCGGHGVIIKLEPYQRTRLGTCGLCRQGRPPEGYLLCEYNVAKTLAGLRL